MKRIILVSILIVGIIGVLGFAYFWDGFGGVRQAEAKSVTVYKSPTCGCCVNYIALLRLEGYTVEVVETDDMASVKQQYGVPREMESCHTSIFGDYVVEGHMPLDIVEQLLKERPDIRGIALPDMPAGSPGMPGVKQSQFTIYSLNGLDTPVYRTY